MQCQQCCTLLARFWAVCAADPAQLQCASAQLHAGLAPSTGQHPAHSQRQTALVGPTSLMAATEQPGLHAVAGSAPRHGRASTPGDATDSARGLAPGHDGPIPTPPGCCGAHSCDCIASKLALTIKAACAVRQTV